MSWIHDPPTAPTLTLDTPKLTDFRDEPTTGRDTDPDLEVPKHLLGAPSAEKPSRPESIMLDPQTDARVYVATDLAKIYVERALKRHDEGDVVGAVEDYSAAIARSPKHPVATYNRGVALLALGRAEEATGDFYRVIELAPELPEAHYNLAISLMSQGQTVPALRHAERALTLFSIRTDKPMLEHATRLVTQIRSIG